MHIQRTLRMEQESIYGPNEPKRDEKSSNRISCVVFYSRAQTMEPTEEQRTTIISSRPPSLVRSLRVSGQHLKTIKAT